MSTSSLGVSPGIRAGQGCKASKSLESYCAPHGLHVHLPGSNVCPYLSHSLIAGVVLLSVDTQSSSSISSFSATMSIDSTQYNCTGSGVVTPIGAAGSWCLKANGYVRLIYFTRPSAHTERFPKTPSHGRMLCPVWKRHGVCSRRLLRMVRRGTWQDVRLPRLPHIGLQ
jgi:hypothetical protein